MADFDLLTMLEKQDPEQAKAILLKIARTAQDYENAPEPYHDARKELLQALEKLKTKGEKIPKETKVYVSPLFERNASRRMAELFGPAKKFGINSLFRRLDIDQILHFNRDCICCTFAYWAKYYCQRGN